MGVEPAVYGDGAILEPADGTYFGVNLNWGNDSVSAFNERLGLSAAVYVQFVAFPLEETDRDILIDTFKQAGKAGGIVVVTLEPHIALSEITPAMADDLAGFLAQHNIEDEVGILIRFAHEMNGSWYSWGQQPTTYIQAFRTIANSVHAKALRTGMLWAPSYGAGYPFTGGQYEAKPGTPDFALLDTNADGALTMADDTYAPYYPGDDAVDWVGLSLYHWGSAWPWGDNEIPEEGKFAAQLTGSYVGFSGDESQVTDFYADFVVAHDKPLAIVETAALYNPGRPGGNELAIKQAWWRQVFSPDLLAQFPRLRMINWFEWDKPEAEIQGERIDWTVTTNDEILDAFLDDLPDDRLIFGPLPPYYQRT